MRATISDSSLDPSHSKRRQVAKCQSNPNQFNPIHSIPIQKSKAGASYLQEGERVLCKKKRVFWHSWIALLSRNRRGRRFWLAQEEATPLSQQECVSSCFTISYLDLRHSAHMSSCGTRRHVFLWRERHVFLYGMQEISSCGTRACMRCAKIVAMARYVSCRKHTRCSECSLYVLSAHVQRWLAMRSLCGHVWSDRSLHHMQYNMCSDRSLPII